MANPELVKERIEKLSTYTEDGHYVCEMPLVRLGQYPEPTHRAWWKLNGKHIPRTHYVVCKCGKSGCIALDHLELAPIAKQREPAKSPEEKQTSQLEKHVSELESWIKELQESCDLYAARVERLEGQIAALQRPPECARCPSSDTE